MARRSAGIDLSKYDPGARKAMNSMQKQYGSNWAHVFYGLANKRTGGFKGLDRGSHSANISYKKGSHWKGTGVKRGRTRRARTRLK